MRRALAAGLALALVALPAAPPGAQGPGCRAQNDVHVCQVEGFGSIHNQDIAQARDEAIIDARRRALEQVAGVRVDAETITRNQAVFDQMIRTETRGVIQADRVLDEGPVGDGRYRARLEAWVKDSAVQDRLESLVSELSIVVAVREENLGQPQAQGIVEGEVVARLVDAGYRVLDPAQARKVLAREQIAALAQGDVDAARQVGLKFLSNLIVVGQATTQRSQNNQGLVSAYARVTLRAIEAETGRIVTSVSLNQVRGFAAAEVAAGERALAAAATEANEKLQQGLEPYFKRKDRRIEVRVTGLPSLDEYRRAKAFFAQQRWVSDVQEGGWALEASLLSLTYPEKTLYLAARIGREPRYRVLQFDRNRIVLDYRP